MPRITARLVVLTLFLLIPAAMILVRGTPPCPWFDYSVTRNSPLWKVTLYPYSSISLEGVFYNTNQTSPPSYSGPWERLSQHVGRSPSVQEPVTLRDVDSSGNITRYDRIEILDETDSIGYLRLGFSNNASFVGGWEGITLEHDYQYVCYNAGPTPAQVAIPFLALTGIATTALVVYMRKRTGSGRNEPF